VRRWGEGERGERLREHRPSKKAKTFWTNQNQKLTQKSQKKHPSPLVGCIYCLLASVLSLCHSLSLSVRLSPSLSLRLSLSPSPSLSLTLSLSLSLS
jgi:hypothetical protein